MANQVPLDNQENREEQGLLVWMAVPASQAVLGPQVPVVYRVSRDLRVN